METQETEDEGRGESTDGSEDAERMLALFGCSPAVMDYVGWSDLVAWRRVCTSWRAELSTDRWWKQVCVALAVDRGLYVGKPSNLGWQPYLREQLWPYRHKFSPDASPPDDFQITVSCRFRPGDPAARREDYFLPLHQWLKIRKPGEQISREQAESGMGEAAIESLASAGESLPPELVRALLDAARLSHAADRAKADSATLAALGDMAFDPVDGSAEGADPAAAAASGLGGAMGGGGGGMGVLNAAVNVGMPVLPQAAAAGVGRGGAGNSRDLAPRWRPELREASLPPSSRRGGESRVVSLSKSTVNTYIAGQGLRSFVFEAVLPPTEEQRGVYDRVAKPVVGAFLNGIDTCLMSYGQTGSGKTSVGASAVPLTRSRITHTPPSFQ